MNRLRKMYRDRRAGRTACGNVQGCALILAENGERMERTEGLKEYVRSERYREALGLPEKITETYELLAQGEYNRELCFLSSCQRAENAAPG